MTAEAILEAVHVLNPGTLRRARRLSVALDMLRSGMSRRAATEGMRLRFDLDKQEAWRLVTMAADIAEGPAK